MGSGPTSISGNFELMIKIISGSCLDGQQLIGIMYHVFNVRLSLVYTPCLRGGTSVLC